ncbi:hypothetical protein E2C01_064859 [Portunus trituberculatus]|uniref:Secreted protein n=1 Tax=Portunus trituberculatus TaxID=210409 RepID=A0A5B7HLY5_PORTR|nr:hypothetical protein [Portunus trituberculatus]
MSFFYLVFSSTSSLCVSLSASSFLPLPPTIPLSPPATPCHTATLLHLASHFSSFIFPSPAVTSPSRRWCVSVVQELARVISAVLPPNFVTFRISGLELRPSRGLVVAWRRVTGRQPADS